MTERWERSLARWDDAGLIDAATVARIRSFESSQREAQGLRWPVAIAIGLGALLLGAGVLLFVAAHWDTLSPGARFALVLVLVAGFHLGGVASSTRFPLLAIALHGVGTVALGAGIFLAGQIFHLQAHWPGGLMLWALGACAGWALLRDAPQAAIAALLVPAWLAGEWIEATGGAGGSGIARLVLAQGLLLLAIVYLGAEARGPASGARRALTWIGALALLPLAGLQPFLHGGWTRDATELGPGMQALGWTAAFVLPLALAVRLRGKDAWMLLVAALWVLALGSMALFERHADGPAGMWRDWGRHLMWAVGAVALIGWGLHESRRARVNLGVAAFALTVLAFYFSTVMDALSRSLSLAGLGLLFVLGGWGLERLRRRLLRAMEPGDERREHA